MDKFFKDYLKMVLFHFLFLKIQLLAGRPVSKFVWVKHLLLSQRRRGNMLDSSTWNEGRSSALTK